VVRAEDEASAVLYAEFEGRGVLLTGNAGSRALRRACSFAEELGISMPSSLRLLQVPNHGNPDNLSSDVLDRLVGKRRPPGAHEADGYVKSAFVSSGREGPALGYGITAAALKRRGVLSFLTQGTHLHHSHDMPERGWSRARIR
jgi:hypothetical protein